MPNNINSFKAINLLDNVDEFGWLKVYNGLTNSTDKTFVIGLSHSSSWDLVKLTGAVNYSYYHLGGTYSY